MKRVSTFALVMVLVTGVVGAFAGGTRESADSPRDYVTLTGQVYFEDLDLAVLKTDDAEYELMVPWFYSYDVEIEEGQVVTVEGFLGPEEMPGRRYQELEYGESHLMVTKATIDGEEYEIDHGSDRMIQGRFDSRGRGRGGQMRRTPRNAPRGGRR